MKYNKVGLNYKISWILSHNSVGCELRASFIVQFQQIPNNRSVREAANSCSYHTFTHSNTCDMNSNVTIIRFSMPHSRACSNLQQSSFDSSERVPAFQVFSCARADSAPASSAASPRRRPRPHRVRLSLAGGCRQARLGFTKGQPVPPRDWPRPGPGLASQPPDS